nr:ALK tyrosine kinase receptor-like isoform X1 [Pocillopora verrucosa]
MNAYFTALPLLFGFVLLFGTWICISVEAKNRGLGCRSLRFGQPDNGFALQGHLLRNITLKMGNELSGDCRYECLMESNCVSVNVGPPDKNGLRVCQLSDSDHIQHPEHLTAQEGFLYWATQNPCSSNPCANGATCLNGFTDKRYICLCPPKAIGENCENSFSAIFSNLGATGRYGPTTLGSHYTGQDHDRQVTLSSGIQQWTVPHTGDYRIEATGAAGGYDLHPNSAQYRGRGARMIGTFSLIKDEIIRILVGQEGGSKDNDWSSGGGGGTFVVRQNNTPLIIAGGGGGLCYLIKRHAGCDASTNTTGNPGYRSAGSGGIGGLGGQSGNASYAGGSGGGFFSNGTDENADGGRGFLQGGVGGKGNALKADGGFGGGGGAYGGGGGGGYSGGGGGEINKDSCGGGGGSFNSGKEQKNECCYQSDGPGQVTITLL